MWPLVVLAIMRFRRHGSPRALKSLLVISGIGALASSLEMALVFNPGSDPTRAYFGTDTHAQCLLVGAALAAGLALWRRRRQGPPSSEAHRRLLTAAGLLGVGVCAYAWSQWQYGQTLVFRGGFLVVSLSVAAVIMSVVLHPTGIVAQVLAWAPLRFIGRISYGMYLWHFPLDIAITGDRTGLHGTWLFLFRTLVTVAVSTISFYGLERPIRRGNVLSRTRARVATPVAVIGTAAVIVLATVSPVGASVATGPSTPPTSSPGGPGPSIPASLVNAPVRVMIIGDSVAFTLSVGLAPVQSKWDVDSVNLAILGCGVDQGNSVWDDVQGRLQEVPVAYPCRRHPAKGFVPLTTAWTEWVRAVRPNVVVLLAGRWEVEDRTYMGKRTNILHTDFAAYTKSQLETAVQIGTSTGARMVLMTSPCFSQPEQLDGAPWPQDDPTRVETYNRLVDEVAAEFPSKVTVQDLYSMTCPDGKFLSTLDGALLRDPDGIHFSMSPGAGAALLAPRILPLWQQLGHEQEAAGGKVPDGPAPLGTQLPRA